MSSTLKNTWRRCAGLALTGLALLCGAGSARADVNAYTDDKSVTVPTGWFTYTNVTAEQVTNFLNANQARLTDIEVLSPTRFAVTMVPNTGVYGAGWFWYFGQTAAQVSSLLSQNSARLIDIEPYSTPDGIRFAVIMVANTGNTARAWSWLVGVSASQISTHVQNSGHRLIDLKAYAEGGVTKYVVIGVANTGSDAKAWQYFFNQTAAQVGQRLTAFNGRLVSLERRGSGNFDMIQVRNTGTNNAHYWRYYFGLSSLAKVNEVAAQYGSRVFDFETYVSGGVRYYNALMLDNSTAENRRIRAAFGDSLVTPNGLPNGQWGAYLKPLGSSASISLNGTRRFEPASAIKAVHNLATMRRIQAGTLSLTTPLTYYNYPSDGSKGFTSGACPHPGNETTSNDVASTVNFNKDEMMTASDNRTTRAITLLFGTGSNTTVRGINGIAAIESIAVNTAQMMDTFIDQPRIGCGYDDARRNQTTLADLGKLYEGVENGTLLGTSTFRTEFYQPMNGGDFGTSGIEGEIRNVVQQEGAALGKTSTQINDFIAAMEWRFKPGGYGIGCDNAFTPCSGGFISIASQAGRLTLPRVVRGLRTERDYVFGAYTADTNVCDAGAASNQFGNCTGCAAGQCLDDALPGTVLNTVRRELFRTAIRENLATF